MPGPRPRRAASLFPKPGRWGRRPLPRCKTVSAYAVGAAHWASRLQRFALRGEFLFPVEKEPKDAGGRRRGELRSPMTAFPQTPITGVIPWGRQGISGAQNLSGGLRFLPAHWGLASPKLHSVRFKFCAWVCRANAPGTNPGGPVWDRPLREKCCCFRIRRRGDPCGRPKAFPLGGRCRANARRMRGQVSTLCTGPRSARPEWFKGRRRGGTPGRPPSLPPSRGKVPQCAHWGG